MRVEEFRRIRMQSNAKHEFTQMSASVDTFQVDFEIATRESTHESNNSRHRIALCHSECVSVIHFTMGSRMAVRCRGRRGRLRTECRLSHFRSEQKTQEKCELTEELPSVTFLNKIAACLLNQRCMTDLYSTQVCCAACFDFAFSEIESLCRVQQLA